MGHLFSKLRRRRQVGDDDGLNIYPFSYENDEVFFAMEPAPPRTFRKNNLLLRPLPNGGNQGLQRGNYVPSGEESTQ